MVTIKLQKSMQTHMKPLRLSLAFIIFTFTCAQSVLLKSYSLNTSTQWANLAWSNSGKAALSPIDYAQVVEVDGFQATPSQIQALKNKQKIVLCYISTGSAENWRPDYKSIPTSAIGSQMEGWPNEHWLLVSKWTQLQTVMMARLVMLKNKGCSGYEGDNMDMYSVQNYPNKLLDTISYGKWLATSAHSLGLFAVWKNALDVIPQIVTSFDAIINEQCLKYNECDTIKPFYNAGKPVWVVDYSTSVTTVCKKKTSYMTTLLVDTNKGYSRCV